MQPITNDVLSNLGDFSKAQTKTLAKYLYQRMIREFDELDHEKDLSKVFKSHLRTNFSIPALTLKQRQISRDGTQKFLFTLHDGHHIETVLIPDVGRKSGKRALCLSTQVGCAMGCVFCLTGRSGLLRNLETWEIIEQFREVSRQTGEPITHLVFMGMGEPLHNYENLRQAITIFSSVSGAQFPESRLTVSTSGLLPQLKRLAQETNVLLALTLSAPNDPLRSEIMPVNRKYSIKETLETLQGIPIGKRERIFIEYVLLEGINDQPVHAHELADVLAGLVCKINLIPFNEIPGFPYRRTPDNQVREFAKILREKSFKVSTRIARGRDISAACGQLSNQAGSE